MARMKKDILFQQKEAAIICEENMGDVNEYQKLLEPLTKLKKFVKGKQIDII
jgi:hypothetical protein